eukprot:Platyproteum_vivax@DN4671_c0_g1_i2.p1
MDNLPEQQNELVVNVDRLDRPDGQDETVHGAVCCNACTIVTCVVIVVFVALAQGLLAVPLVLCAFVPVAIYLALFLYGNRECISLPLYLETFWLGAILSTSIAVVLELVSQLEVLVFWGKIAIMRDPSKLTPAERADIEKLIESPAFFLVLIAFMVTTIGLIEEFAKLCVVSSRIKVKWRQVPYTPLHWWRLVESPKGMALAGIAAGGGFAAAENISYVLSTTRAEGLQAGLIVAGMRAVTAIPAHIAMTGAAAAGLALFWYQPSQFYPNTGQPSCSEVAKTWMKVLGPVVLLHGVYDASLVFAGLASMSNLPILAISGFALGLLCFAGQLSVFALRWAQVKRLAAELAAPSTAVGQELYANMGVN